MKKMYAVLTYCTPKSGNHNSRLSAHIGRQPGEKMKENIDPTRTHQNRLIVGSRDLDAAAEKRIQEAGITRKLQNNTRRYKQILLSASPPRIHEIFGDPELLQRWIDKNLKFLYDTFGKENVINVTLHMDEKSPHLHCSVVPITDQPAKSNGKQRKTEKRYKRRSGLRLSDRDVFCPEKSEAYQDLYAAYMKEFGLQRGEKKAEVRRRVAQYNAEHPTDEPIPIYKPKGMGVNEYYRFIQDKTGIVTQQQDAIEDLEKLMVSKTKAVKAQETMIENLKRRKAQLDADIETAKSKGSSDLEALKAQQSAILASIADRQKKLDETRGQLSAILDQIAVKQSELAGLDESITEKLGKIAALQAEQAAKENTIAILQGKVTVAQNAAYCYHLTLFAMRLPGVDEALLVELEQEMKRMRANALAELEMLLLDFIMILLKLLFGEATKGLLAYFSEPIEKRFGLSLHDKECHNVPPEWVPDMVYRIAETYFALDDALQSTECRVNDWLADPRSRTRDKVVDLLNKGELDGFIQRLRQEDPAHAPQLVREVFDLLNMPALTRAAEKREQQAESYRKRGWW